MGYFIKYYTVVHNSSFVFRQRGRVGGRVIISSAEHFCKQFVGPDLAPKPFEFLMVHDHVKQF